MNGVRFNPRTTAFVAVDLQSAIVAMSGDDGPAAVNNCRLIANTLRGRGGFVVWVRVGFAPGFEDAVRQPADQPPVRPEGGLPEVEDVEIDIQDKDIRIDTFRASGSGGQHVNKTDSAVRITHLPSGIVVTSSEKSQHVNRDKAMKNLRVRLYDMQRQEKDLARSSARKSQVGSGDRSERIRTYNFPQGRVTDHRIGLTLHSLPQILEGDLDPMLNALIAEDQAARLADLEAEFA